MEKKLPLAIKQYEIAHKKKRQQLFDKEIVHILAMEYSIEFEGYTGDSYVRWFTYHDRFGKVEYFPTGNKVHVHRDGSAGYHQNGIRWIIENLK